MAMLADRNLLFGIVALQMDFITRAQLMAAMNVAVSAKDQPLGEILLQQGALSPERRTLLDALVQEQMKQHGGDPQQSLAAVSAGSSVRAELARIADADLQASLAHVPAASTAEDDDSAATRAGPAAAPAGTGVRYRILRPHAEGGLGKVSVALDEELRREVALKEIKERHADNPESRTRFIMEAEITGGLEHPGIVPVYGLGTYADGRPFYAMRFIRGDSLKEAIDRFHQSDGRASSRKADVPAGDAAHVGLTPRRSPDFASLEFRKLLGRFIDVCNAIAYAHSRGVLHRDLKPGNIMLGKYGETLVVDWGLAKAVGSRQAAGGSGQSGKPQGESASLGVETSVTSHTDEAPLTPASGSGSAETVAGSAIGTPQFMSPEQAAGRLDLLGPASDVYSLGATLYCLLTGKAPIEESDVGTVLRKVQKGDFPSPRQVNGKIPCALDAICLRAMSVRPGDRYRTPRKLADDVERWLGDERVLACPEPVTARLGRWARRHRTLVSAATGLLLASAILLGISTATFREMHKEADELREQADKALRAGQRSAYVNAIRLAHEHWEDSDPRDIPELLDNAGPPELRSWEWGHLKHLLSGPSRTLLFPPQTYSSALSPDGTQFAAAAVDGTIKVWDVASGKELFNLRAGELPQLAFTGDGKHLVAAGAVGKAQLKEHWIEIKSWHMDDGRQASVVYNKLVRVARAISPDATRVVGLDANGTLKVWEVASGQDLFYLDGGPMFAFAFSGDGKWAATGGVHAGSAEDRKGRLGDVNVWEIATGKKLVSLPEQWYRVTALAFHPHLQELAVGCDNGLVTRWDLATRKTSTRPLWEHTGPIRSLEFSRDGAWLASGGADRAITLVSLKEPEEPVRKLRGHFSAVNALAFDPVGKKLISAGTAINYWDLARPPDYLKFPSKISNIVFDSSGRILNYDGRDITLVNTDTARTARTLDQRGKAGFPSAAFNKKGGHLALGWRDGSISIQKLAGGPPLVMQGHKGQVNGLAFSPAADGLLASASDDGVVKLWDMAGTELLSLPDAQYGRSGLAFSPDGTRLAIGGADGIVRLWDPVTNREIDSLPGPGAVNAVAFHPKGNLLVTFHQADHESVMKLWQLPSGLELPTVSGHAGSVWAAVFTPDGRRLVTGSTQGRIKFWDLVDGNEVFEINLFGLLQKDSPVHDLAFSPDGLTLAAATGGQVLLWKALPWNDTK